MKKQIQEIRSEVGDIKKFITELRKYTEIIEMGNYFKLSCPFHEEKNPSFVIYKNGKGFGNDFHYGIGDKYFYAAPFDIWCKLKYKIVDKKYLKEFAEISGAKLIELEKSSDLIESWAEDKFKFIFKKRGELYSDNKRKYYSKNCFKDAYDDKIIEILRVRGVETGKKKTAENLFGNYKNFCVTAFDNINDKLPDIKELKEFPEVLKNEFINNLAAAYHKLLYISQSGGYSNTIKTSIYQESQKTKNELNEYWVEFTAYGFWINKIENKVKTYFDYIFLYQCFNKLPYLFEDQELFEKIGIELKMFEKTKIIPEKTELEVYEVKKWR